MILLAPPVHEPASGLFGAISEVLPQIVVLLLVDTFVLSQRQAAPVAGE